jgi:hypothetical protein
MSALEDRRQAAREAYHDAPGGHATYPETRLDIAIETATRVRITPEIIDAATRAARGSWTLGRAVRAAFEAAGFEVEQ